MNKDGTFKKEGDTIVNPQLAETLRVIQEDPESFYSGKLAKKIAADFENNDGIITEKDLKNYDVGVTEDVLKLDLGDITMLSCPLPSGGPVVTQILNILQSKFCVDGLYDHTLRRLDMLKHPRKLSCARKRTLEPPAIVRVNAFHLLRSWVRFSSVLKTFM